jgi:glycosyltransferase involved in cell wall biosynthesis
MGEYARCLALAHAVRGRWPGAAIHFLLSEQAPYARSTPYEYTLFAASPTLHDREGREAICAFRPDVVVFDNAGRKGQLAAAHALGAGVVYVSSRWRPRTKAFRLRWLPYLDEHWIPYPEFVGGSLTRFERLKQRLVGRPRVRFLDVMLPPVDPEAASAVLARHGLERDGFTLLVAGGGTPHPNASANAQRAPAIYDAVAARLAAAGHAVAVAGRSAPDPGVSAASIAPGAPTAPNSPDAPGAAGAAGASVTRGNAAAPVRWCGRLPPHELAALLGAARLVVTNGGDTLLQSLACGRPTVAAPIAADQPARLGTCAARGGIVAVELDEHALARAALDLLADEPRRERLAAEARAYGLTSGIATALDAFGALLGRR